MKSPIRIVTLVALTAALTVAGASSAFAWHVDTGKDQQAVIEPRATASQRGPKADPFHRIIVKVSPLRLGACTGWVEVPDAQWAQGTEFTVRGTDVDITRGERATLPAGDYVGDWSNSREVERFTIRCVRASDTSPSIDVTFRYVGRDGVKKRKVSIPAGCTYRSPWVYMQPETKFWVQDRTNKTRVRTFKAGKAGFYGPLYRGYVKGVSC